MEILDNVIVFLRPSINPDGQDIVVNSCKARFAAKSTTQPPIADADVDVREPAGRGRAVVQS